MKRAELIDRLRELADYAEPREWDLPLDLADVLREAAAELSKMQWVPTRVSPEDGQPCLVYTRQRERLALVCQWEDCDEYEINSFDTFEVTHWMPLPEPPEEVEG